MPGSFTSVFGEAETVEAALREDGFMSLLVIEAGVFRARLTQITLDRLRLVSSAALRGPAHEGYVGGRAPFRIPRIGRFAASYRAPYGELPSATLRRASLRRSM
jgi:hypothetical protein